MGWAIRRADGTYRCWNAHTQDDALQPGESWEMMDTAPMVTPGTMPPKPPSPLALALAKARASKTPEDILDVLETIKKSIE